MLKYQWTQAETTVHIVSTYIIQLDELYFLEERWHILLYKIPKIIISKFSE